jgi:U4/U6.U5 tri-snRNP-associated protein 1
LDKYTEELDGERKKSFRLDKKGVYDASDSKFIERLNQEHKARAVKLDALNELKHATDYFTPQEMEKFKKPKKIRKVLRKSKMLKADDLMPLPTVSAAANHASRVKAENGAEGVKHEKQEPTETSGPKKISLKDIDFGLGEKSDSEEGEVNDEDEREEKSSDEDSDFDSDKLKENEDFKKTMEEENNVLEELHSVLSKTRNKITQAIVNKNKFVKHEAEDVSEKKSENGIDFDQIQVEDQNGDALTLDTMSEFCRNLPYGTASRRDDETDEEDAEEAEKKLEEMIKKKRDAENMESDEDVEEAAAAKMETGKSDDESDHDEEAQTSHLDEEGAGILDDEPILDRGLASCLKLAVNKGYLAKEKEKLNARGKANIEAKNYMVEEKNYYDIDDKYNRGRDRFSGPLSTFEEKSNYKPDVKLEYIDEKGHAMNEKEAFRYLSHKFHGKGSGKKKTEKRLKKIEEVEAMKKMSSTDTPLNTVALMAEKQKRLQQPYVVLSTQKGKQDQVTLHKR